MQTASQAYKAEMKKQLRDRSYIRVTIGLINQEAQASASVPYPGTVYLLQQSGDATQ